MINTQLLNILQREIVAQELQLSPYCAQQIEQLVTQGIGRMTNSNAADHPGRILIAQQNLKSLIKYFSEYSRKAGSFPQMTNSEFDAAMRSCPTFWPYSSSG